MNKQTLEKLWKMKQFDLELIERFPTTLEIPELKLKVVFEILDAQVAEIGQGLNVLNTTLKIVSQTPDPSMVYTGVPLNQISEDMLDKVSKFKFDKPAKSQFRAKGGKIIDVYAEPLRVRYSENYVTALGIPHYNITTMSGACFVPKD